MPRRDTDPDFIESIARGFDVVKAFDAQRPVMTLSEVATSAQLARPTARRILRTLESLGYVRPVGGGFALTPRVLETAVTRAIDRLSKPIADGPNLARELHAVEQEIARLTEAIAVGGNLPALVAALQSREGRRRELIDAFRMTRRDAVDPNTIRADLELRLRDWRCFKTGRLMVAVWSSN